MWVAGTRAPHQPSTHRLFVRRALGCGEDLIPFFIFCCLLGLVVVFETRSYYVAQVGLELMVIFLPRCPEHWDPSMPHHTRLWVLFSWKKWGGANMRKPQQTWSCWLRQVTATENARTAPFPTYQSWSPKDPRRALLLGALPETTR